MIHCQDKMSSEGKRKQHEEQYVYYVRPQWTNNCQTGLPAWAPVADYTVAACGGPPRNNRQRQAKHVAALPAL